MWKQACIEGFRRIKLCTMVGVSVPYINCASLWFEILTGLCAVLDRTIVWGRFLEYRQTVTYLFVFVSGIKKKVFSVRFQYLILISWTLKKDRLWNVVDVFCCEHYKEVMTNSCRRLSRKTI